jgi:transcriptional regulator with XRE-family HTH domain
VPRQHPSDPRLNRGRQLLGDRLRDLRLDAQLGLPDLVARTGISMGHLSDCERGQKSLSLPALFAVAEVYGLLVTELLDGVYPYGSRSEAPDRVSAAPEGSRGAHGRTAAPEWDPQVLARVGKQLRQQRQARWRTTGPPDPATSGR